MFCEMLDRAVAWAVMPLTAVLKALDTVTEFFLGLRNGTG